MTLQYLLLHLVVNWEVFTINIKYARDNVDAHRLADVNDCLTNDRRVYAERSPKSCCRTSRFIPHITFLLQSKIAYNVFN